PRALAGQAARLAEFLPTAAGAMPAIASALVTHRGYLSERAVVVAGSKGQAVSELERMAAGQPAHGAVTGRTGDPARTVFVFPGQGAQRAGMGRQLSARYPVFAAAFDEVCDLLDEQLAGWVGHRVRDVVFDSPCGLLDETVYTQAGLFAVEVALARLLDSWGVRPDLVLGHSIGELAAVQVAGLLSLPDAARVVAARGRLMQALGPGGAMVAVNLPEEAVEEFLRDGVELGAVNSPDSVVLSGAADAVLAAAGTLRARGVRTRRLRISRAAHSSHTEPMLGEFAAVLDGLTWREPTIPVVSTMTGALATASELSATRYWTDHVRHPVRFASAVRAAAEVGGALFLEAGPGTGLSGLIAAVGPAVPAMREGRPEDRSVLTAAGELFVRGVDVDWHAILPAGSTCAAMDLPTYAFDHDRYWLPTRGEARDAPALGLAGSDHPLLPAVVEVPETDGVLASGRLSTRTQPWLADHAVGGVVLLPGAGLVELAVRAGDEVGCGHLRELVIEAPLVLPARAGVRVQVSVGGPDERGVRSVSVHSAPSDRAGGGAWTRHATGLLAPDAVPAGAPGPAFDPTVWPPADATEIEIDPVDFYAALRRHQYEYGPAFRGLRAAWRRGEELFAEVALPAQAHGDAARFVLHPALLDAALHARAFAAPDDDRVMLPFAWNGVTPHAAGATSLRVRVTPRGPAALTLAAWDDAGRPVLTVEELVFRPITPGRLRPGAGEGLYEVAWTPLPVGPGPRSGPGWPTITSPVDVADLADDLLSGAPAPTAVVLAAGGGEDALAETTRVLEVLQTWLAGGALDSVPLVVATRGAVASGVRDPVGTAVWGLVRAAQAENPDRFVLADLDPDGGPLPDVLATGEPQIAVRGPELLVPRLSRLAPPPPTGSVPASDAAGVRFDPGGTVLITGGTGSLGRLLAGHLVEAHGVRSLVLASRGGPAADGVDELVHQLRAYGAEAVEVVAIDAADPAAVIGLVERLHAERRLSGVIHAAGVFDAGVVTETDPGRLATVFASKVVSAQNLDRATRGIDLDVFVTFSSVSGTFLGAGTGGYGAANAYLDGLVAARREQGWPGVSLAWGAWEQSTGMAADLDDLRRTR
ncbi:type I polyketide synthase, partial [Frankia sp. AgKG'84/4]|uniref:type I polyketide synthase n=1 Tax=Frankia sp. AgKG'84/4 TaxID=573490 RepID=UPI00202A387A